MDELVLHKVKECCMKIHSNVQRWKELSSQGFDLASQIVNLSIEKKYVEGASHHGLLSTCHPHLKDKLDFKMLAQREALFAQLKVVENDLLKAVANFGSLASNLKMLAELILTKSQDLITPPFSTLSPTMFGTYSEEVYCAYSQEMSVKEDIIRDLLGQPDRDVLTVYLSCWLHEPYLTDHVNECLEALLIDCGLRS